MNYIAGSVRRQYEANPGPIFPFGIALFDLEQENKFIIFGQCWRWSRQKRQNTVKFDLLQTQLAFFPSSWDKWVIFFARAHYFCHTAKPLLTKHVQSRGLNISLFGVFLWTSTLSRSTITHTQKKKTQRMQQSSSLRLDKNEYLFAFINDMLSFSFTFLLLVPSIKQQGYCFKRWNVFLWI